jgi:hypothetical protein
MSALVLAGASSFAFAQGETDWADVEGRIQYAYYTNDARALASVLGSLKAKTVEGEVEPAAQTGMRAYFRALAQYRVAQVLAPSKKAQSNDAIDECEDEIDVALQALPKIPIGLDESDAGRRQRAEIYTLSTASAIAGRELTSDAGDSSREIRALACSRRWSRMPTPARMPRRKRPRSASCARSSRCSSRPEPPRRRRPSGAPPKRMHISAARCTSNATSSARVRRSNGRCSWRRNTRMRAS